MASVSFCVPFETHEKGYQLKKDTPDPSATWRLGDVVVA